MGLYDLDNRTRAFGESRRLNVGTDKKPVWITNVHAGDDYAETYGNDRSYAIQNGVVVFSGWSSTYGWHARYRLDAHPDVIIGHHSLEEASPLKKGDPVRAGSTFVGRGGDSASGANGNHVHIQAERSGKPISPRPFIVAGLAGLGGKPFDNRQGFLMALSDAQQAELYDLIKNTAGFVYAGGTDAPSYPGMPGSLVRRIRAIEDATTPNVHRTIDGETVYVSQIQDNADTNTFVRTLVAQVAALQGTVSALALGQGSDPEAVKKAAREGAEEALAQIRVTVTTTEPPADA